MRPIDPLLIPGFALLGGVLLLWLGRRGRRVNHHPVCRKCGYDLFGLTAATAACPECGRSLTRKRATRSGQRVRQPRLIGFAVILLIVDSAWLGRSGWVAASRHDFSPYKPVWWLLRDTDSEMAETRVTALNELLSRLRDHKLHAKQIRAVAEHGLSIQADVKRPWDTRWEQWMELAERRRSLSEAQWRRYAAQSMRVVIRARPSVVRGEPAPLEIYCFSAHRGGTFEAYWLSGSLYVEDVAVSDLAPSRLPVGVLVLPEPKASRIANWQTARAKVKITAYPANYRLLRHTELPGVSFDATAIVTWVLTEAPPPLGVITDAGRQSEESCVVVTRATWSRIGEVAVTLESREPPVSVAADVVIRRNGREWVLGSVLLLAGEQQEEDIRGIVPGFDPAATEVVLRPDPAVARQVIEPISAIWGKEIRFPVRFHETGPLRHE